jgi:hypothetical protein
MASNRSGREEEREDADEMEEVCPGCGMDRSAWQGNAGEGDNENG